MLAEYVLRITLTSAAFAVLASVLPKGGTGNAARRVLALIETVVIAEPLFTFFKG